MDIERTVTYGWNDQFSLSAPIPPERAAKALSVLVTSGQVDGAHHKAAVIDHAVRILAGTDYDALIQAHSRGGEYSWDIGIQ